MLLEFYKYQGTGNDFIIVDNREAKINLTNKQVNHLCNRKFGIGADGLMLMQLKHNYDFEMIYFNADGKPGSMCGNGGRCMVQFANDKGLQKESYFFKAVDGDHAAAVEKNGWIDLKMKDVDIVETNEFSNYILNTGSPHFVKPVTNVWNVDVLQEGREIRYNDKYKNEGINVNFVETDDEDQISVRTYERGVEDETMSCGTGVTASALVFAHNDKGFNRVSVKTPGGELAVEFNKLSDTAFNDIWLCGPASFVFKGEIEV